MWAINNNLETTNNKITKGTLVDLEDDLTQIINDQNIADDTSVLGGEIISE